MNNVYKRGNAWVTCVQVQGRRIRRSFRTQTEALACAKDLKQLGSSQRWGDIPKNISWSFFKLKHAELTIQKAAQTRYRDANAFAKLESCYPITKLQQITPQLLESLKAKLLTKNFKKPAINRCLTAIKAAMRKAESWKYIHPQDWRSVSMLKTPPGRLLFYSLEELGKLESKCKGVWLAVFMLGYEAGLRPLEKSKLEISDVHWKIHKLYIHNSKGGKSRWVPMTERLEAFLRSYPMGQQFVLGDDQPSPGVRDACWRKLVKKAKLKGSEYTLRHTFASHYVMNGGRAEKLMVIMGHSSIKTTQIYMHLSPESLEEGMKNLPAPVNSLRTPLSVA